jgi:hypothetical protein
VLRGIAPFDRDHQLGTIVLRNATGGRVRPDRLGGAMLRHLIEAKRATPHPAPSTARRQATGSETRPSTGATRERRGAHRRRGRPVRRPFTTVR